MAIVGSNLTAGADTTDANSFPTASVTLLANRLILAAIGNSKATTANVPTLSSTGATWVQIATLETTTGGGFRRATLFRTMVSSDQTGVITIGFAGVIQAGAMWSIDQFTGVDTSGTNGSGAVVQNATAIDDSGTATSLTITLAAFADAVNNTSYGMGIVARSAAEDLVPGTGFVQLADVGHSSPIMSLLSEWKSPVGEDISVDFTWTTAAAACGIAVEVKAAASAATDPALLSYNSVPNQGRWWQRQFAPF